MNPGQNTEPAGVDGAFLDGIWKWLDGYRGAHGFRAATVGPETMVDTCCAVLVLEGIGRLADMPEALRTDWREFIQGHQHHDTGLFEQGRVTLPSASNPAWWHGGMRDTWFALQALDALGAGPRHRFAFLDAIGDAAGIKGWLKGLDWSDTGTQADLVACVLQCLIYRVEVERDGTAADLYHATLDALDALQHRESGLWGSTPGVPLAESIVAAQRLLDCYEYVHRPVMRVSKMLDAALGLVAPDGSLTGGHGASARSELAVADLLTTLSGQCRYRREEIQQALGLTRRKLLEQFRETGRFLPAPDHDASLGDVQAMWLRLLLLATTDHAAGDLGGTTRKWHYRRWPAQACHRIPGRLNASEKDTLPLWFPRTRETSIVGAGSGQAALVSVVIPCFNLGRFLHWAVESVQAQSHANVEIVIVDDGSTDEFTIARLESFERSGIRIIRQGNRGVAEARNVGIRATTGPYVCCLDPDDLLQPAYLRSAVAALDADAGAGIVTGGIERFDELDDIARFESISLPRLLAINDVAEAAVFRREGWERIGGYAGAFSTQGIEDWNLWISFCELGYRIHVLPEVILRYRVRTDQMSTEMYRPDRWGALRRELVERHADSYVRHVGEVVSILGAYIAETDAWTRDRNRAIVWWQRNAGTWQRIAEQGRYREIARPPLPPEPATAAPHEPAWVDPKHPDFENTPASNRRPPYGYAPAESGVTPAVTIVTPYFNADADFLQTTRCVLRQSFQQWEWIIVNDGSNDPDSLAMLDRYRHWDPRVRVLDQPVNLGPSAARNTGFRAARAPYVVQLDVDDLIEPTAIEKWFWFLETHPEFGFAKGYTVGFGAQQYLWSKGFHNGSEFLERNLLNPTGIVRRAVHKKAGGYNEADRIGLEDWDFWLRCASSGNWGGTVPEFLDWYRRRRTHTDRWANFDEGERMEAYRAKLRKSHSRLWDEGGFPRVESTAPVTFDRARDIIPCENRLAKRKPRVLMLVPWLTCGGADRFNVEVLDQLTQRGWEATVATTLSADSRWAHEFARYTPDIFVLENFLHRVDYPRFLRYLIDSRRIDVVLITHSALAYQVLPYLQAHCPDVAFVDFCHIDELVWANGGYPRYSVNARDHLDLSIVSSEHLKRWMIREGGRADRIRVCYTNVDADRWQPDRVRRAAVRRNLDIPESTTVILFAGRICEQKQPRVLGESLRLLHQTGRAFTAIIAGDGPDFESLKQTFVDGGMLASVRLLGEVSNDAIRDLMAAADIFFLPSQWEGISLAIYEAMASGLAIVGADAGGQRELVTPECGVLIERGTEEQESRRYAEELGGLLADPVRRAELGRNARNRVCASFKLAAMGSEMDRLLIEARRLHVSNPRPHVSLEAGIDSVVKAFPAPRRALPVRPRHVQIVADCVKWLLRPAYHWGLRRGWVWPSRLRARVRRMLSR